jgi:hypothetical protein
MSDTTTATPVSTPAPEAPTAPANNGGWDDAPEAPAEPTPAKAPEEPKRKPTKWLTVKVDGKEERVSEDELLKNYSKFKAADSRFQEASKAKQSVEAFMKALQDDPEKVLSDPNLPIDRAKLAEKWLYDKIQAELTPVDPNQAKIREYEEKLKAYQAKEEQEKLTIKEQEFQATVAKRKEELGNMFSEAMKQSSLSKNPETAAATLREMALYYRAAKAQGETPTPEELAAHVEQKYFKGMYELANTLEGEDLVKFLGDQIVKKIRSYDLNRLKAKSNPQQVAEAPQPFKPERQSDAGPKESLKDAQDRIRKMLR